MVGDTIDNFKIAPEKLSGRSTYDSWARIARMSIASKKKLGYITGTKKAPEKTNVEAYETWEEENCTVQTWLLNSMEKHVRVLFDRLPTAAAIWSAVEKTYTVSNNSSRIYELTRRSVNVKQEGRTLEAYYEELQTIWQELDAINPPQIKNEIDLCTHLGTVTNFRVYILLAGLDSHLDGARAHVLRSDPLPDVLEAYAMICEEDSRLKTMGSEISGGALAARKGKEVFFQPGGSNQAKDGRKCTHCGKNHTIDKCWKLHGRPEWADELIAKRQGNRASLATVTTIENEDEAKSAQALLLAFQHYIVMLGTTVLIASTLVPRMGGDYGDKARVIQSLLFMSGVNTLLQTLFGTRLPTVMGPSVAFTLPVLSIIHDYSDASFASGHEMFSHNIRTIQGSLIVSSFVNIVLGYSMAWGNLTRFFSPIVIVPVVCVVGLGLFMRGFPLLGNCVEIGLPMLILLVVCQQYLKRIHPRAHFVVERFALLFCIAIVWAFAAILTVAGAYNNVPEKTKLSCRTDRSHLLSSAPWIKIPYPFQWGTPIFRASHVFGMTGAALVTSAESTGTFFAASRLAGATAPPAHVLSRSIGLQGVGMLIEGIFGSVVGTTASVENVGLLGLTHIGSRRVVQISTAFMIFFSIFGKFGAFFASIPLPIFAAIYCVLLGIVAAVGITFIQFANCNSMRNIYVLGLSLFLGISIPQYFVSNTTPDGLGPVRTDGGWFNDILNTIFSSPPTVAMIVGTLLDNTLEAKETVVDRGVPWWKPFQHRKGDGRNEEFYSFPLRINEYLPTRFL